MKRFHGQQEKEEVGGKWCQISRKVSLSGSSVTVALLTLEEEEEDTLNRKDRSRRRNRNRNSSRGFLMTRSPSL